MRDEPSTPDRRMPADTADWIRNLIGGLGTERADNVLRERVQGIERLIGLKHRARVLDLGCGSGRQTVELARRHYRVLGMDIPAEALAKARLAIRNHKLTVHFLAGDMRRIPYAEEFDAAINLQNPIGCYPTERDDLQCLQAVARALKSEGKLLLDLVNREWLITRLSGSSGGRPIYDLRAGTLDCRGLFHEGQTRPAILERRLRVYTLTEIHSLLARAGFELKNVWGDFAGGPYGIQSERMIVLAQKLPEGPSEGGRGDGLVRAMRIKGRPR